jgi:signal transduction histidine kinase/ActR/RegA family two-component response regulator
MERVAKKCLLITKDAGLKSELEKAVSKKDFKISCISSADNLYSTLKKAFNVLVLDTDDLKGNVVEIIENIKIYVPELTVVVVSSKKSFQAAKGFIKCDVFDLLNKPINKKELLASLTEAAYENADKINKKKMLKLAQQRAYDILLLKEIAESTTQSKLDINLLLEKIVNMIADILDVQTVSIMMLNEKTNTLKVNAYLGPREKEVKGAKVKVGEGFSGFVAKTGKPLLINNLKESKKFSESDWKKTYTTTSLLSVPVKSGNKVLGITNVNNKSDNSEFNENDKNILVTISHQVAMAIENFWLYSSIKEKASQLEKSNDQLSDLNNAKSELLCNLSHELKTPLTSVIGYLELLLTFTKDDSEEDRKNFLEIVHSESLEIAQLIDKILNFFDLDTNRIQWNIAAIDLNAVLERLIEKYSKKIEKSGITFRYTNKLKELKVQADQKMLTTALEQLFDNAVKFNDDRCKLTLKVEKYKERKKDLARISIFNTGNIIKKRDKAKIFQDFYQPGSIMTEKPQGLGLGLATTRGILKKHKGNVRLDTSDKKGNTFICTIPLATESS